MNCIGNWSKAALRQGDVAPARLPFLISGDLDRAAITIEALGPITATQLSGTGGRIARPASDCAPGDPPAFTFVLQIGGAAQVQQFGNRATLREGDLCLCDTAAPFSITGEGAFELLMLQVPRAMLQKELPRPRDWCGRRLARDHDLVATAGAMAQSVMRQLHDGLDEACRDRAARQLLGLIAGCYSAAFELAEGPRSPVMADRLWHVRMFIEQRLRDPDLSPARIAAALKLSSRYLRMIFARGNESLSAYILRRRLEECALCLRDPRWADNSITEIAFSWGFNSAPHFTRSFRERYQLSPRDYRARKVVLARGSERPIVAVAA